MRLPRTSAAMFSELALVDDGTHMPRPVPVLRCTATELHLALPHALACASRVHVSFIHDGEMIAGPARVRASERGRTVLSLPAESATAFGPELRLADMPPDVRLPEC